MFCRLFGKKPLIKAILSWYWPLKNNFCYSFLLKCTDFLARKTFEDIVCQVSAILNWYHFNFRQQSILWWSLLQWYVETSTFMMMSSNGHISALLALCARNSPVTGEFPAQRSVTRSFEVFFDLRLNKQLSKQSWGWWFEMPSRSLWRHCNVIRRSSKAESVSMSWRHHINMDYVVCL